MRYTVDCEFLEDGRTIDLISIGMVAEDGREYYAINDDAEWFRVGQHTWLMEHVVPHLPEPEGGRQAWNVIDKRHPDVKLYDQIAAEVEAFLTKGLSTGETAETWAYYSAYDHVALCQLFGPLVMAPTGVPMRTNCLAQEEQTLRRIKGTHLAERPVQDEAEQHHALHDARFDMQLARWLGVID